MDLFYKKQFNSLNEQLSSITEQLNHMNQGSEMLYTQLSNITEQLNHINQGSEIFYKQLKEQIDSIQTDLWAQFGKNQISLENINALVRRSIHDTNSGFFEFEFERNLQFGGQHSTYNNEFYRQNRYNSYRSGIRVLTPIIKALQVKTIIDFGCGTGTWLYAAKKLNVNTVYGIDGDYINRNLLLIHPEEFHPCDLSGSIPLPGRFDLALSVEVAEHLPESCADTFVQSLCSASDIVLFSAAHTGQGGNDHINERPFDYWKHKFEMENYFHIEIRSLYQGDWEIESWYRENIGLFVHRNVFKHISEQLKL